MTLKADALDRPELQQLEAAAKSQLILSRQMQLETRSSPSPRGVSPREELSNFALLGEELLAEIICRLPFEERLQTVPLVCKDWRSASHLPWCWRIVDMSPWFQARTQSDFLWELSSVCYEKIEFLIKKVVDRSAGHLLKFRTMHCSDAAVDYISQNCPLLKALSIPESVSVTDQSASRLAKSCTKLEELDISDCYDISGKGLEAFGSHCPSLVWLARNMVRRHDFQGRNTSGDEEAMAVAKHMPTLRHLEMKNSNLSDRGLAELAKGCRNLESLNLACCTTLSGYAIEEVPKLCQHLKEFIKPLVPRMHVHPKFVQVYILYN